MHPIIIQQLVKARMAETAAAAERRRPSDTEPEPPGSCRVPASTRSPRRWLAVMPFRPWLGAFRRDRGRPGRTAGNCLPQAVAADALRAGRLGTIR
jgi:hypothetical protein